MTIQRQFSFVGALGAQPSEQREGIDAVQDYLVRYGYLPNERGDVTDVVAMGEPGFTRSALDARTQEALRHYQALHGLPATGIPDSATIAEMGKPRCGFPDVLSLSGYALLGNKWSDPRLSYRFNSFTSDLPPQRVQAAVQAAMQLWAAISTVSFLASDEDPDIEISFVSGSHGDGYPFDGPGDTLAHAFFPPPSGGALAGDIHFDEAERWSDSVPTLSGRFDLVTVAAHELGHSLGLGHSSVRGSLMFPSYSGPQRYLHRDDIDRIRALYGS